MSYAVVVSFHDGSGIRSVWGPYGSEETAKEAQSMLVEIGVSDKMEIFACRVLAVLDGMPTLASRVAGPITEREELRRTAGVSLRKAAAELGVHPMTVLRWERGETVPRESHRTRYEEFLTSLRSAR